MTETRDTLELKRHCVYAYMEHIRSIPDDIREIEQQIKEIEASIDIRSSVAAGGGTTTPAGDKIGSGIAILEDKLERWDVMIKNLYVERDHVRSLCLPTYKGRYALWLHKVEAKSWPYVARILGYSERQAKRFAEQGIIELYRLMPEEWRRYTIPNALPY